LQLIDPLCFIHREDLHFIGLSDFEALAVQLGSKPYLMGNAPSVIDCTAFGFLVMFFYVFPPDYYFRKECERRFPNLRSYVERIKKTYWPDWEECLAKE
jgi:glutathione S-transferase